MMGSGTALEISILRTHAKDAYQSLLACYVKKIFHYSATTVTNHLQKNYALL